MIIVEGLYHIIVLKNPQVPEDIKSNFSAKLAYFHIYLVGTFKKIFCDFITDAYSTKSFYST